MKMMKSKIIRAKSKSDAGIIPTLMFDSNHKEGIKPLEIPDKFNLNNKDDLLSSRTTTAKICNEIIIPLTERIPCTTRNPSINKNLDIFTLTPTNDKSKMDLHIDIDKIGDDVEIDMNMPMIQFLQNKKSIGSLLDVQNNKDQNKQFKRYTLFNAPKEQEIAGSMVISGIFSGSTPKANGVRERRRNYLNRLTFAKKKLDPLATLEENEKIKLEREHTQIFHVVQLTEEIDKNDTMQTKAQDTLKIIKKFMKKQPNNEYHPEKPLKAPLGNNILPPLDNLATNAALKAQIQQKSSQNTGDDKIKTRKSVLVVEDPSSILHMANYAQNHDFAKYTEMTIKDNQKMLKLNVADTYTFFRLQHEIGEMRRKEEDFREKRLKHLNKNKNSDLTEYDKKVFTPQRAYLADVNEILEKNIKSTKAYQKGLEIGKLLKPGPTENKKINIILNRKAEIIKSNGVVGKFRSMATMRHHDP